MPTVIYDTGTGVEEGSGAAADNFPVKKGEINRVVWVCWTGSNPMPYHLRLCLRTIRANSGLPVIMVTPANVKYYVPNLHPGYQFLHLAHRADYLRSCLLHLYGGLYLDCDTICLRSLTGLFDLLEEYDVVGYDGSPWMEYIGVSDMGPFKPGTEMTSLWFDAVHKKMEMMTHIREDAFYWQEILRDIVVPCSIRCKDKISKALRALNPSEQELFGTERSHSLEWALLFQYHILILNNANYGKRCAAMTEEEFFNSNIVLSQLLREALGDIECTRIQKEKETAAAAEALAKVIAGEGPGEGLIQFKLMLSDSNSCSTCLEHFMPGQLIFAFSVLVLLGLKALGRLPNVKLRKPLLQV
eukprot:gnl/MRDRNA2_/MRDRNA2_82521_c0_seq1.p1 gnl/MRDRNA2_/MRDRNA2_82521_c0~~gnl/MRDRNA2_/MRDRNA2_82521_c0_seq1.p1  ORF type:complete len:357 (+),score=41.06 gnl/MRDRNA2_/MRDRNA2_82521_c0_seq1:90-1160(+)